MGREFKIGLKSYRNPRGALNTTTMNTKFVIE